MTQIELSDPQSIAWNYLEDQTTTEALYGGAAGGGKSFLACLWHVDRRVRYAGSRGVIGRAKISNLEQSTLITLFKVCTMMGYIADVDYKYNQQKHIIQWRNGSATILKDLFLYPSDPDFTSLGSTEYTDAIIDEGQEVTRKAKEILSTRIRFQLSEFGLAPKMLITCNPGAGWIREDYIGDDLGNPVILPESKKFIRALLTDNPDEGFKKLYTQQLENLSSDYDKSRLLYGDWYASREVKNPFAHQYDSAKHEQLVQYDPYKILYVSIDFNLVPMAATYWHCWEDDKGHHAHCFDEETIDQANILKWCDVFRSKYERSIPMMKLTGDAMGKHGNITERDNASNYELIRRTLRLKSTQIELSGNPTHDNSRSDVNYVLFNHKDFKINPVACQNTVRDMKSVECDAYNSIIKKNRKDLSQRADHIDTVRYFINTFMRNWIKRHQKQ